MLPEVNGSRPDPGTQVSNFTDTSCGADFSATICWGDGSSDSGTVPGESGTYTFAPAGHLTIAPPAARGDGNESSPL